MAHSRFLATDDFGTISAYVRTKSNKGKKLSRKSIKYILNQQKQAEKRGILKDKVFGVNK